MKKLTGILLTLILTLGLTACGSSDPASVYASAVKKYNKADGAAMILTNELSVSDGSIMLNSVMNGVLKIQGHGTEEVKAAMEGNIEIDMGTGSPMVVPISYYYTAGYLYANMAGTQYKMAMTWDMAMDQMGAGILPLMGMEKEDFQELTMKEDEEKETRTLSFILPADKVPGAFSQWEQYKDVYGDGGSVNFQNAKGNMVIQDGRPASETLIITGTLGIPERSVTVTSEINLQITTYEEVEVAIPDLGAYRQLGEDLPVASE